MADLLEVMKLAGLSAVSASKPMSILFGQVAGVKPLKIKVEQKMTLEEGQLILTERVTEHEVEMTVEHETEAETGHVHRVRDTYSGGGASDPTTHGHGYRGRKKFLVHGDLKEGEVVILLREQGGQRFLVLDRVGVAG